ncbi:hypothetical protein ROA7450_02672 [Roseovarius albus]|uniref:DUF2946 domain-containing protein n=1 Tax=Roseovarius albus TaxID=1247867 RepID=A0A1X6ZJA1_9RHOB|nr:hypothetical protein [Roseovarius albus]SLN52791.1 hypothetical protein ROA7450_02672 [Roseovarius albus]
MAMLLAFVLALRVIAAPVVMAAPEPGLIALCSGGKIVYVSLETGAPVPASETDTPHGDPCPFFGITAALDSDRSDIPAVLQLAMPLPLAIDIQKAESLERKAPYHSRAPPLFS